MRNAKRLICRRGRTEISHRCKNGPPIEGKKKVYSLLASSSSSPSSAGFAMRVPYENKRYLNRYATRAVRRKRDDCVKANANNEKVCGITRTVNICRC